MIDSITRITLNLQETNTMVSIRAKRGDTGRKLLIHLSDGSIPYHISDDCYATFTARKADGTKINNSCTIENNVIAYEFTEQTCTAVGTMKAEIRLYGADRKMITSACFLINVYDTVFRDGDEVDSEGEMNTLDDLILRANAFLNETGKLLRWQGNWDNETEYEANDLVLHEQVLYVAEEAIAAGTAPRSEEVTAWVPIAGMGTGNGSGGTPEIQIYDTIKTDTNGNTKHGLTINGPKIVNEDGTYISNSATVWDGKTAYAYAKEAGYTGTEEEFAQKLASEGSGGKSYYVVQDTAPEDTSVLWVDTDDDTEDIPQSGGISVTGAKVGQTVKISAVDENGVPTAWMPTDFPSGGGSGSVSWKTVVDYTLTEGATQIIVDRDADGKPFSLCSAGFAIFLPKNPDNTNANANTWLYLDSGENALFRSLQNLNGTQTNNRFIVGHVDTYGNKLKSVIGVGNMYNYGDGYKDDYFSYLSLYCKTDGNFFPAGTRILIAGIHAEGGNS